MHSAENQNRLDAASQDTNLSILLIADDGVTVPVESLCERLLTDFPGAVITAQNSFAAKRLSFERFRKDAQERLRLGTTLEPWMWKTMDEVNNGVDRLIAHNRRVELRSGPKKDVAIPLSNGTQLVGHVGAKAIQFRGQCWRSDETVANLARFLELYYIGTVEVLDHGHEPKYGAQP